MKILKKAKLYQYNEDGRVKFKKYFPISLCIEDNTMLFNIELGYNEISEMLSDMGYDVEIKYCALEISFDTVVKLLEDGGYKVTKMKEIK